MSATCNDMADKLLDYLYGELPSDDRSAVENHVAGCVRCQLELKQWGHVRQAARELTLVEPPAAATSKLLFEAARQAPRHGGGGKVLPFVRRVWRHPAYAMAASFIAVAGITGWQLMRRGNVELAQPQITAKSEPAPAAAPSAAVPSSPPVPETAPSIAAKTAKSIDVPKLADRRTRFADADPLTKEALSKDSPPPAPPVAKGRGGKATFDDLLVPQERATAGGAAGAPAPPKSSETTSASRPPGVLYQAPPVAAPAGPAQTTSRLAGDEDAAIDEAVRQTAPTVSPLDKTNLGDAPVTVTQQRAHNILAREEAKKQLEANRPPPPAAEPRKATATRRDSVPPAPLTPSPSAAEQNLAGLESPRRQVQGAALGDSAAEPSADLEENVQHAKQESDSKNDDTHCRLAELRVQSAARGNLSPDDLWTDYLCLKRRGQGQSRRARQDLARLASEFPSYRTSEINQENAYFDSIERQLKRAKAKAKTAIDGNK